MFRRVYAKPKALCVSAKLGRIHRDGTAKCDDVKGLCSPKRRDFNRHLGCAMISVTKKADIWRVKNNNFMSQVLKMAISSAKEYLMLES